MTKFAAYDDQAIWGVGDTEDEALQDAKQWIGTDTPSDFDTAPMTKALAARVEKHGFDGKTDTFGEFNGTLMTYPAYERAKYGA